jgi:peptide/nickel transport system ATP-binding protein
MLFITHNLGVVASVADTVLVMEHGCLCETGSVDEVLAAPGHDYTRSLLKAAPSLTEAAVTG